MEVWGCLEATLVKCWENGLQIRSAKVASHLSILEQVDRGELPSLAWKGGFEIDPEKPDEMPKMKKKYGCLQYLATLQGIKGEALYIDSGAEVSIRCSRTGVLVVFTANSKRWAAS